MDDFDDVTPTDDLTPTDSPETAIRRFTGDQRDICESLNRFAPLLATSPRSDRPFLLEQFIALARAGEQAHRSLAEALAAQLELESVFRPRP